MALLLDDDAHPGRLRELSLAPDEYFQAEQKGG
jgi:hypothetical protein